MVQPLWKTFWQFLNKLNIELSYDPAIPFLGVYPKELKTGVQTRAHAQIFTAALFTIDKRWKQPKCPSADEWIKKCGISVLNGRSQTRKTTHII